MRTTDMSLTVQGWRGINHSYALVNQFQLLEMLKHPPLALSHIDAPFHYPHWNRSSNGAGFHAGDEALLSALATPGDSPADWVLRIFSPLDLKPPAKGTRLAVFAVTEYGLDSGYFAPDSHIGQFEADGGVLITPSHWSGKRMIEYGFRPETVHVVPHGVSRSYFQALPQAVIDAQKAALGFAADEVILLNIGAAIWNKGIDVLLKAFALARQKRKDLRLVFKDQRNTYGISGENFVQSTLSSAGLLSADVLNAITLIPANLTMDQMNSIYNVADCYVSPYRAEGFNLPVAEALACGVPVIVTEGGATDDFVNGPESRKLRSTLHLNAVIQQRNVAAYCEPDADHLVELLATTPRKPVRTENFVPAASICDWSGPVNQILALLKPPQT